MTTSWPHHDQYIDVIYWSYELYDQNMSNILIVVMFWIHCCNDVTVNRSIKLEGKGNIRLVSHPILCVKVLSKAAVSRNQSRPRQGASLHWAITYQDKQKSSTFVSILAPGDIELTEDALMTVVSSFKLFFIYMPS